MSYFTRTVMRVSLFFALFLIESVLCATSISVTPTNGNAVTVTPLGSTFIILSMDNALLYGLKMHVVVPTDTTRCGEKLLAPASVDSTKVMVSGGGTPTIMVTKTGGSKDDLISVIKQVTFTATCATYEPGHAWTLSWNFEVFGYTHMPLSDGVYYTLSTSGSVDYDSLSSACKPPNPLLSTSAVVVTSSDLNLFLQKVSEESWVCASGDSPATLRWGCGNNRYVVGGNVESWGTCEPGAFTAKKCVFYSKGFWYVRDCSEKHPVVCSLSIPLGTVAGTVTITAPGTSPRTPVPTPTAVPCTPAPTVPVPTPSATAAPNTTAPTTKPTPPPSPPPRTPSPTLTRTAMTITRSMPLSLSASVSGTSVASSTPTVSRSKRTATASWPTPSATHDAYSVSPSLTVTVETAGRDEIVTPTEEVTETRTFQIIPPTPRCWTSYVRGGIITSGAITALAVFVGGASPLLLCAPQIAASGVSCSPYDSAAETVPSTWPATLWTLEGTGVRPAYLGVLITHFSVFIVVVLGTSMLVGFGRAGIVVMSAAYVLYYGVVLHGLGLDGGGDAVDDVAALMVFVFVALLTLGLIPYVFLTARRYYHSREYVIYDFQSKLWFGGRWVEKGSEEDGWTCCEVLGSARLFHSMDIAGPLVAVAPFIVNVVVAIIHVATQHDYVVATRSIGAVAIAVSVGVAVVRPYRGGVLYNCAGLGLPLCLFGCALIAEKEVLYTVATSVLLLCSVHGAALSVVEGVVLGRQQRRRGGQRPRFTDFHDILMRDEACTNEPAPPVGLEEFFLVKKGREDEEMREEVYHRHRPKQQQQNVLIEQVAQSHARNEHHPWLVSDPAQAQEVARHAARLAEQQHYAGALPQQSTKPQPPPPRVLRKFYHHPHHQLQ
eukprot:PhM_4_TR305/c0_g1_i1/m.13676